MSAILKAVYDAFLDAGASEQKSTEAAQAIADYEERFKKIESDLLVIKWMIGLVIVVNVLPMIKTAVFP